MSADLLKYLDGKIRQLREELEYYEAMKKLVTGGVETTAKPPKAQDLDSLPWRPYKDGGGEWVYRDEAPDDFVTQLLQAGKPFRVGDFVYSMKSGSTGKTFISRRRVK